MIFHIYVNDYIPFNFINKFSQLLYDISNLFKIILISFILLCVIIISSSYSFYHIINGSNNEDQITFKIPLFLKYLYFYDKIIIVLLFNLLLLTLLVMGETSFSKIGGLSLICFISRNGFTIFASYDYFIKIFYIVFEYQYCLSLSDNIFIAFGEGHDTVHAPQPIQYSLLTFGKSLKRSGFSTISGSVFALANASVHAFLAKS